MKQNKVKLCFPLLTATVDYTQALCGNILLPCKAPPARPPSGHRCLQTAPPSWPLPPARPPPPPCSCYSGRSCTPLSSSSFSVWSASCSFLPCRTPSAFAAPSLHCLKTLAPTTEAPWSVRTPPIGAVPQITDVLEMLCDERSAKNC